MTAHRGKRGRPYFVFHGVTYLKPEPNSAGWVNSTVTGYGTTQGAALLDARKRERARYGKRFASFGNVAHVSGPHRALAATP